MIKKILFLAGSFIFFLQLYGQVQQKPLAADLTLPAYSNFQQDVFSFTCNTADLARKKTISSGLYSERRFMVNGIDHLIGVFIIPSRSGSFGIKIARFGDKDFSETTMGLSYGKKLFETILIGAQFNYHSMSVSNYIKDGTMSFGIGVILQPIDKLNTGFQFNRTANGIDYSFGIGYDLSQIFLVSCQFEKTNDKPAGFSAGFSYKIMPRIFLRTGITNAFMWWVGAGFILKTFRVDLFSSYHPQLGITPGLALQFKKEKNE